MYLKVAFELVKQAVVKAGTTETWPVFQQLDKLMKKRYSMTHFSAPLWRRVLGIVYISDLEKMIQEVAADADVATGQMPER